MSHKVRQDLQIYVCFYRGYTIHLKESTWVFVCIRDLSRAKFIFDWAFNSVFDSFQFQDFNPTWIRWDRLHRYFSLETFISPIIPSLRLPVIHDADAQFYQIGTKYWKVIELNIHFVENHFKPEQKSYSSICSKKISPEPDFFQSWKLTFIKTPLHWAAKV